jgi:hypothetical protein
MQPAVTMSLTDASAPYETVLKLQGATGWQVNIRATFDELAKLRDIRTADWDRRAAIMAGTSAGGRVFWCAPSEHDDPAMATVLIGPDDEVWDIAFQVPVVLAEHIADRARLRRLD